MEAEIHTVVSYLLDQVCNYSITYEKKDTTISKKKHSLRAETTGLGALLTSLRSTCQLSTSEESMEIPVAKKQRTETLNENETLSENKIRPLNRKERRALNQEKLKEKYKSSIESSSSIPVITKKAIPPKLNLIYCDEKSFQNYQASFGYKGTQSNNYVRFSQISPSSKFAVVASQDRYIRLYNIENRLPEPDWSHNLGGLIYDLSWIKSSDMEIFATTSKDHPIHVWNAENGEMFGAYIGKDYADAVESAFSVGIVGNLIIGGYKNNIKVWKTERGGKPIITFPSYDKKSGNGLIGKTISIDANPQTDRVFAAVGCSDRISIYSEQWKTAITTIIGSSNGYTHIKYSQDSNKLFASERKGDIHVFDVRMNALCQVFKREMKTNHRSVFDIDFNNRLLYSGTSSGEIVSYDIDNYNEIVEPFSTFRVSSTCVPCVSSNQSKLVVCTGERIYPRLDLLDSDEETENTMDSVTLYPTNSFQLFDVSF